MIVPGANPLLAAEYCAVPIEAAPWVVHSILPVAGSVLLYGAPKLGKTFVGIQLAAAIAGGGPFFGLPVQKSGPVLYIQADMPPITSQERVQIFLEQEYPGIDHVLFADRRFFPIYPFNILRTECSQWLSRVCALLDPVAVFIDVMREIHGSDEKDDQQMQAVIGALRRTLGERAHVVLHHDRKPSVDRPESLLRDARGSGYLGGAVDTVMRVRHNGIVFQGRGTEGKMEIKLEQGPSGIWRPLEKDAEAVKEREAIEAVWTDPQMTQRAKARVLAETLGISEEAARTKIRRFKPE